jgi:hypothetical protein
MYNIINSNSREGNIYIIASMSIYQLLFKQYLAIS